MMFGSSPQQYRKIPEGPIPPTTPKYAYGAVKMTMVGFTYYVQLLVRGGEAFFRLNVYTKTLQTAILTNLSSSSGPDSLQCLRKAVILRTCGEHISDAFH